MNEDISEISRVIELAFAERNYSKVIEVVSEALLRNRERKELFLMRGKAYLHKSKQQQCLRDLSRAQQLGASIQEVGFDRVRAHLELGQISEARKALHTQIEGKQQIMTALQLHQAIEVLQDRFGVHRLNEYEEKLFLEMKEKLYGAGAQFDKLEVVSLDKEYRGVIAKHKIYRKTPIVYIPKSEIMTLEMAKLNRFGKRLIMKEAKFLSPKHTYMSILLLEEKANIQSKWRLYIDSLPTDHSCFPINYNMHELEMLEGSPFLFMIHEKVMDLQKDYTTILKIDSNFEKYTFKEFCWARMMVGSRIFGVTISGVKTEILVPFADMLNHQLPKQTAWNYSDEMNGFVIESLTDIEIGQEVFDSYGRKCNSRFLLNYGFVIPQNMDNEIALKICINTSSVLFAEKAEMLKISPYSSFTQIMKTSRNLHSGKFFETMGLIRFITVDSMENIEVLAKISKVNVTKEPYKPTRTPPISVTNEIKAWQFLLQLCREMLVQYKTTLEEDQKLFPLASSQNEKNILTLRMGEKQILKYFIEVGQELIKILTSDNIIEELKKYEDATFFKFAYKILSLMPGINKQSLEKRLGTVSSNKVPTQGEEEEGEEGEGESCIQEDESECQ